MKELLEENNAMLRFICNYIIAKEKRKDSEDLKNFMANLVADLYSDKVLNRGNIL